MDISVKIYDYWNNTITNWNETISIRLSSKNFNFETDLNVSLGKNGYECSLCETGIYLQNVRMDTFWGENRTYSIKAEPINSALLVNNLEIKILQCPLGYGLNLVSSQCQNCSIGEFSIESSISPCKTCNNIPSTEIEGIACNGRDEIIISKNYWVSINYSTNYDIVSKHCPSNYCAQREGDHLSLKSLDELCAKGRDHTSPLCGKCKEGLSELYGSANCGECDANSWWLCILYATYSMILTVLLVKIYGIRIIQETEKSSGLSDNSADQTSKCFTEESSLFIRRAVFKVLPYHYQSLSFIFLNTGIFIHFMALVDILSLRSPLDTQDTGIGGFCWITGLTAKYEIMLRLLIPIFCALTLVIMGIIYKIKPYKIGKTKPYFIKSSVGILLLFIGTISGICFELIACRTIDNQSVHFYFGNAECFDFTWCLSLIVVVLLVTLFCSFFVKLFLDHQNISYRHFMIKDTYILSSLLNSYKTDKYWYWEVVIFLRRFIIAMLIVLTESIYAKNILFIVILIFLFAQMKCNPFRIKEINTLESICLGCLLATLYILKSESQNTVSIVALNFILLLPFLMFLMQFYMINSKEKKKPAPSAKQQLSLIDVPSESEFCTTGNTIEEKERSTMKTVVELVSTKSDENCVK